jgi:GcrA cell cycle regulator
MSTDDRPHSDSPPSLLRGRVRNGPSGREACLGQVMTMIAAQITWTPERVALLKNRIGAGFTCGQIACEIGLSRNAVIGKATRLGLLGQRARARKAAPSTIRRAEPRTKPLTHKRTLMALRAQPQFSCPEVPENSANRCSLFELKEWHCRWPMGDPTTETFGFCGSTPVHGLPYCAAHARIGYRLSTRSSARNTAMMNMVRSRRYVRWEPLDIHSGW